MNKPRTAQVNPGSKYTWRKKLFSEYFFLLKNSHGAGKLLKGLWYDRYTLSEKPKVNYRYTIFQKDVGCEISCSQFPKVYFFFKKIGRDGILLWLCFRQFVLFMYVILEIFRYFTVPVDASSDAVKFLVREET